MKGLLFFGLLILLVLTIAYVSAKSNEGFANPAFPQIKVPPTKPAPTPLNNSSPAPYLPPIEKAYGPAYGKIARVNTLPYRDPALEPAPYRRLAETLEDVKGFLVYEAPSLKDLSDPAVQLPLTNARSDKNRLEEEVNVLSRNPGLSSQLTMRDVDQIQANLAYLQRTFRLSVNQGSPVEGFEDVSSPQGERATLTDLKDVRIRITAEITRLSASGTTDPVFQARIATLQNIGNNLDTLIREVENGTRPAADIPVFKKDLANFLPVLGNTSQPIPKLIDEAGLPPVLSNLFPAYGQGDISGARLAQYVIQQYGDAITKGLSWNLTASLDYTSPRATELTAKLGSAAAVPKAEGSAFQLGERPAPPRGELEEITQNWQERILGSRAVPQRPITGGIDWKAKTADICNAIRKRGLDPSDFGCVKNMNAMSDSYSWRGHARMVCQRLLTTPDPGLPELCGCPPLNWPGWKA